MNKAYLDKKLSKKEGQISYFEKDYNEFNSLSDKESVEEVLVQRAVKTVLQILYAKCLFDSYNDKDAVLKKFLPTRGRLELEEVNANEIR